MAPFTRVLPFLQTIVPSLKQQTFGNMILSHILVRQGGGSSLLARDYQKMQPMFFGEAPPFVAILKELARIEQEINSIDR